MNDLDFSRGFYFPNNSDLDRLNQEYFDIALLASYYVIDCAYQAGIFGPIYNVSAITARDSLAIKIFDISVGHSNAEYKSSELLSALNLANIGYDEKNHGLIKTNDNDVDLQVGRMKELVVDENDDSTILEVLLAYLNYQITVNSSSITKHASDSYMCGNIVYDFVNFFLNSTLTPETSDTTFTCEHICIISFRRNSMVGDACEYVSPTYFNDVCAYQGSIISRCVSNIKQRYLQEQNSSHAKDKETNTKSRVAYWIIAIIVASILVSGFGFFMSFTSYITFSAINIVAPFIAALGLAAAVALPVGIASKKYCDCSCGNKLVEKFRNCSVDGESPLGGSDVLK
jgi:hypothetical protein